MSNRLKAIIAVVNDKGGVGKTTTATNLAVGLGLYKNQRVLLIDLDAQCNASLCMGWDKSQETQENLPTVYNALERGDRSMPVYQSLFKNVFLAPSSSKMAHILPALQQSIDPITVLSDVLNDYPLENYYEEGGDNKFLREDFDVVVIDCPPSLNTIPYNALYAATHVIIPVQMEPLSISGLQGIITTYNKIHKRNNELRIMGVLRVMYSKQLQLAKSFDQALSAQLNDYIFETAIRSCADVPKSQQIMLESKRQMGAVVSSAPYSNAGLDYKKLVNEVYEKIEKENSQK